MRPKPATPSGHRAEEGFSPVRGPNAEAALHAEIVESITDIEAAEWDRLLGEGDDAAPFMEHRFLACLEDAGTLGLEHGWIPRIPVVRDEAGALVAAAPAYIKLHSQGEFVFDFSWANFADQIGEPYYPKLLVGVPFTPVRGRRILTAPGAPREKLIGAVARVLLEMCEAFDLSSVHVNFGCETRSERSLSSASCTALAFSTIGFGATSRASKTTSRFRASEGTSSVGSAERSSKKS